MRNLQDGVEESNDSVALAKEFKMLVSRLVACVVMMMRMTIPPNAQMNNPPGTVNGIVGVAAGVKLSEMHAKKPVNNVKPKKFSTIKLYPKIFPRTKFLQNGIKNYVSLCFHKYPM